MIIGILALQGAFIEHKNILDKMNIQNILIKKKNEVVTCDGIILPGGESSVMSLIENEIFEEIRKFIEKGKVVWGTCAGMILLSKEIIGKLDGQKQIGGLNVKIQRNYFGSQIQSFIEELPYPKEFTDQGNFQAVFIRAPVILTVDKNTNILCKLKDDTIVAVQQENILGTSFHPELLQDCVWHKYFIHLVQKQLKI